jgi:DNA replication licensing factor MCM5
MIFLVRDIREEERDRMICQHVMGVHIDHSSSHNSNGVMGNAAMNGRGMHDNDDNNNNDPTSASSSSALLNTSEAIADHMLRIATTGYGELNVYAMKKYIQYCKMKCSPRLSEEAGNVLTSSYVKIRDDLRQQNLMSQQQQRGGASSTDQQRGNPFDPSSSSNTVIPITVRQLEALVRISESLAKMRIDSIVRVEDVTEAIRLFQVSTMTAANTTTTDPSTTSLGGAMVSTMNREEIDRTESLVRSRLNVSNSSSSAASHSFVNRQKFLEECVGQGYNALTVARVLHIMIGRGEILEKNQGRLLKRIK